ncbi:hypothetical protein [Arthrobacter sp. ISL-28]|uniref:hypothetical protein n=1 Tax=Arthrobacter sp. ISL-28 TaxID=2819108 RepID=UPI001BED0264|nr:hypothetical protein [Arthrobacter sp. ISL-28]MBT2523032.1 hypothetical protein [Arthrobacter sp. ISL-28]
MSRLRFLASAAVAGMLFATAVPAVAAAPERSGPFATSGFFVVDCGEFAASVSYNVTTRYTRFSNSRGEVTKVQQFSSDPADVWMNLETQEAIVVRTRLVETWDAKTGQLTVVGFRYIANESGDGTTLQEVGRIVYSDQTERDVVSKAGQHQVFTEDLFGPALCDALG